MATQSTRRAGAKRNGRAAGKWRSWETTEGVIRAPHRSMMRAMGMSDADIDAPFVGVASTHNEVTPCNAGIKPLVDEIKVGVRATGGSPFEFGTITVSDAISMGTEGMRGSLISREIIADSIETVCFAERYDGSGRRGWMRQVVARRHDGYGTPRHPVCIRLRRVDPARSLEGRGHPDPDGVRSRRTDTGWSNRRGGTVRHRNERVPWGPGSCGGMFTANTMSSIGEALGLVIAWWCVGTGRRSAQKRASSRAAGVAVMNLLREGIYPRHISDARGV